jgi:diguanylate cyclase (GGDEF)-like protein
VKLNETARQYAQVAFGLRVQALTNSFQEHTKQLKTMRHGGARDRLIANHHIALWRDLASARVETYVDAYKKGKLCLEESEIDQIVAEIETMTARGLRSVVEGNRGLATQQDYLDMKRTGIVAEARQRLRLEMFDAQLKSADETRQHPIEHDSTDYDVLLPILNRARFDADLLRLTEVATEDNPLCLIMVDCDHFKQINDTFGHPVGDEVLKRCATIIKSACERKGFFYRYGGEEFSVLLPNYSLEEAAALAERIRARIENADFQPCGGVTVSLGIACYPETTEDRSQLVKVADDVLYEAKAGGRNRAVKSRPDLRSERSLKSARTSPLKLELGYKRLNQQHTFVAKITNSGSSRIEQYQLDVLFPKSFLRPQSTTSTELNGAETGTHRAFRVTETTSGIGALLPGDSVPLEIPFWKEKGDANQTLKATVFSANYPSQSVEKRVSELLNDPPQ